MVVVPRDLRVICVSTNNFNVHASLRAAHEGVSSTYSQCNSDWWKTSIYANSNAEGNRNLKQKNGTFKTHTTEEARLTSRTGFKLGVKETRPKPISTNLAVPGKSRPQKLLTSRPEARTMGQLQFPDFPSNSFQTSPEKISSPNPQKVTIRVTYPGIP